MSASDTSEPLVIAVSVNGERRKEDNPNIPRSHDEIVATALGCYDAGASILHAHNCDITLTGREAADDYLAAWRRVRAERPGALWYPTLTMSGGEELEHVRIINEEIGLEFACVDPGCVPVGRLDDEGLPVGSIYANSFEQIRSAFTQLREMRLGAQLAIYEPNYLRTTLAYHTAGKLPRGTVANFYFSGQYGAFGGFDGMAFGLPPTRAALEAYLDLIGDSGIPWTVSVWGGDIFDTDLPRLAIEKGGHVQVGLESHLKPGSTPSNEEQVARVAELASAAGRPLADREATLKAWRAPKRAYEEETS